MSPVVPSRHATGVWTVSTRATEGVELARGERQLGGPEPLVEVLDAAGRAGPRLDGGAGDRPGGERQRAAPEPLVELLDAAGRGDRSDDGRLRAQPGKGDR